MKTKLFRRFDLLDEANKTFRSNLGGVLALRPQQALALAKAIGPLTNSSTPVQQKPIVERLEEETGLSPTEMERHLRIAQFFIRALLDEELAQEDTQGWADDLIAAEVLAPEQGANLLDFVTLLKTEALPNIEKAQQDLETEIGVLPVFLGAGTTVELRGVFKNDFKWGSDLNSFEPAIVSMLPVISVAVRVDSGLTKTFVFQTTPRNLDYLIDELKAAQKAAQALQRFAQPSSQSKP